LAKVKHLIATVTNDLTFDRRMQRICRTLATNGYAVTLVGRELPNSKPLCTEPFRQHRLRCWFNKGKLFYLEFNIRLWWYLLWQKADMVCAIDLDTIVPCFVVGKWKGWKRIYDAHEYFSEVPEVVHRPMVKKVWEWVAKVFIPKADLAYTVGPALAEIFATRYHTPFYSIRNVPDETISICKPPETGYLLYQGALNKGRGLEALLMAMQEIDLKLKIAGEGDLSSELREMAKSLGVADKVEFLGFVQPADLPELTAGAWLGLNLLENMGLSYYYSLANKCFDYIQAEVPALHMDFPEYRSLVEKYPVAILLMELSPEAIVNAVNTLQLDKPKYNALVNECHQVKKNFTWQLEAQKLLTLYRDIRS
jgi:glycosyltransferase involved in cell wall biosynthesis